MSSVLSAGLRAGAAASICGCVNAASSTSSRQMHGRRVLLLASSSRSWSLTALEPVDQASA
ncbi:hypothetical protein [Streptomyces sp. CB02115]|uniref:hypothetical protein n=1 Tax=Streptomyces sp. CB02115 TaxID=1703939 RepID=UPI00093A4D0C|nr:hypothetical protein [Streptomyces sp. CB02115]OKJ52895.1 hypothetical protein AMK28_22250 [Streptomyces sp. CB02115]